MAKNKTIARSEESSSLVGRSAGAERKVARGRGLATAFLCYVILVVLLASGYYFHPLPDQPGMIAQADITAPFPIRIVNEEANTQRRLEMEPRSPEIWILDSERSQRARLKLNSFADMIRSAGPQNSEQLRLFVDQLNQQLDIALDATTAGQFLPSRLQSLTPPLTLTFLHEQLGLILDQIFTIQHIVSEKVRYQSHAGAQRLRLEDDQGQAVPEIPDPAEALAWPADVREYLLNRQLPGYLAGPGREGLRQAAADLLIQLIGGPDIRYSPKRTAEFKERQRRQFEENPIIQEYHAGDVVVATGQPLTRLQAEAIKLLNERRRGTIFVKLFGVMALCLLTFVATWLWLSSFRSGFRIDPASVLLHALPVILGLMVAQGAQALFVDPALVRICFPAAMIALLASLTIDARAGFLLVLVASSLFGVANQQGLDFLLLALGGGFASVYASRQLRERGDLIQVAWKVGAVNVAILSVFSFMSGRLLPDPVYLIIVFMNAMISVGATLFLVRFFERFFGVVTDMRLLELTGLRHPLITQLEDKAPGSYQHVLNVTKLAEAAANAIGANYLLVRAGALFHDVGKMVKPKYFSENQVTIEDKKAHSRLSPYMSVLIIKNHVKEGVELARRFGLPQKIVDFIPQHHGSGLIRYFYGAALRRYEESAVTEPVREEDFRYPGPRPQSIEAAIVMLADSVEAIAASKFTGGQVSIDEIRRVCKSAISERFDDGQFDECDLTLQNLREIREAFVRTLSARYHFRIAYPALPKSAPAQRTGSRPAETTSSSISVAGPASRSDGGS